MALETATLVPSLVDTNPTATDAKSQGDDHIRMIKDCLLNSFAGWTGLILITGTEAVGATTNDYVVTVSPAPAAYTTCLLVFKATHTNSGASTLKINSLTAKTLKDVDGGSVASGDITNGALCLVYYDGADFYLLSANDKAFVSGDTYTGTHNFTGATITVPSPATGDEAVSRTYMDAVVMAAGNLPDPTAHSGELISSDGVDGVWTTKINSTVVSLANGADDTKLLSFDLSGLTTSTTKTIIINNTSFTFTDPSDTTKRAALSLSGITTGNTRTVTVSDRDVTLDTPVYRWIETVTASSSATLDITGFNSTLYKDYLIVISGMDLATTNADLLMQWTIGGSLRTSNYYYHTNISNHTAATYSGLNGSATSSILLADDLGNKPNTDSGLAMNIYLFNIADTAKYPICKWSGVATMPTVAGFKESSGIGGTSHLGALTTVRLLASSGNIKDGTAHLYGIRRS